MTFTKFSLLARHLIQRVFLPLLLTFDKEMTWRFCLLLTSESIALTVAVTWLRKSEVGAWDSFLYFMLLALTVPMLALQFISRLLPQWSETTTFKYLAIFGIATAWFAGMSGHAMVSGMFQVRPEEFPNALRAATLLAMGQWMALVAAVACIPIEIGVFVAGRKSRFKGRSKRIASPFFRMFAVASVLVATLLTAVSLDGVTSISVRQVITARVAWDADLLPAPLECVPKENTAPSGDWRILPRAAGASETLAIRGHGKLPEKPFWKFSKEEIERFSSFDVIQTDCSLKQVPVDTLRRAEQDQVTREQREKELARFRSIEPVARIRFRE